MNALPVSAHDDRKLDGLKQACRVGAAYLYFSGSVLSGILLGVWGLVLVSLSDNILRPLLIGRKADIPTFILFIALLGGLQVYGFLGLLLGPLVVTLLTALVQIYREEYAGKATE